MILEDYLGRNAGLYPGKTAVVINGCSYTYGQLKSLVDDRVRSIADSKYQRFVCLKAVPSIDFIVDYFAYHLKGIAVVPLAKDIPQALSDGISEELSRCEIPEGTADILYTTGTTGKSKGVIISHRTIMADAENLTQGQGFTRDTVFVVNGPLNHIGSLSKIYPVILNGGTMIVVDGLKDLDAFFRSF
ncbi:MAG: AMP-binding protein, partial [Bacteroidales bacterium]|nr:AMP-binding protein [Bacteroidales bacterium]